MRMEFMLGFLRNAALGQAFGKLRMRSPRSRRAHVNESQSYT